MECRILLNRGRAEWVSVLESEHCLMLGAVVLIDAADVLPQRDSPNEQQKQTEADRPVDQVKHDASAQGGIDLLQFGRRQQGNVLVHENEKGERDNHVEGGEPTADGGGFFSGLRS